MEDEDEPFSHTSRFLDCEDHSRMRMTFFARNDRVVKNSNSGRERPLHTSKGN